MKKILFFVICLFSCLQLFSKSKKEPAWIMNPYAGYDEKDFICQSGSGSSYDAADKKAALSVGQVIQQTIEGSESVSFQADSAGYQRTELFSEVTSFSDVKNITGLTVKDHYKDKKGVFYSRAVLDKRECAKAYSMMILKASSEIDDYLEAAEKSKNAFEKAGLYRKAYNLSSINDYYSFIVSSLRGMPSAPYSYGTTQELYASMKKALSGVTAYVNVSGDVDNRITTSFLQVLNEYGIKTTGDEKSCDFVLMCNVSFEDAGTGKDGIFFNRSNINYIFTDVKAASDVDSFTKSIRTGKLSKKEAESASVTAMEKLVKTEFSSRIEKLLN